MKEGSDGKVDFEVSCDPPLIKKCEHSISKVEGCVRPDSIRVCGNTIYFKKVKREDAGKYTISCSNVVGEGTRSICLNVKGKDVCKPLPSWTYRIQAKHCTRLALPSIVL